MDIVSSMVAFVRVAATGSFTAAANDLQVSIPYVSRSVRHLEKKMQARLINRTTRRLTLTDVGQTYLVHARQIIAHIEEAEAGVAASQHRVDGILKIVISAELGQGYLVRAVAKFCELYPGVRIELDTTVRIVDPSSAGYDVALVVCSKLPDLDAHYQKLGKSAQFVCASPGYLRSHGLPINPDDLSGHRWLRLRNTFERSIVNLMKAGMTTNVTIDEFCLEACSMGSLREAITLGMGVGILPQHEFIANVPDGNLVKVLPSFDLPSQSLYSIYPAHKYLPLKTRAWLSFIKNYHTGA